MSGTGTTIAHTPGPWTVEHADEPNDSWRNIYASKPRQHIATVHSIEPRLGTSDEVDCRPNADLIVAACNACMAVNPSNPIGVAEAIPELVATVQHVAQYFAALTEMQPEVNHGTKGQAVRTAVSAVLAKLEATP